MKKIIKENVRLILGSLSVLIYIGFVVRRMIIFRDFIAGIDGDISYEAASIVLEVGTDVLTIRIAVFTIILMAILFLIYKKQ